ncbi:MAG TPA: hypothetical protein VMS56_02015 [Thermoanaerobaculia bacterium]|nr:hypothetical protein [Thermoanaerobaculia bacterium]
MSEPVSQRGALPAAKQPIAPGAARDWLHAAAAGAIAVAIAFAVMDLGGADLRVPLERQGDALLHIVMVQGMLEEGWPLVIERAGAPGALDFRDFPAVDNFNLLLIRIVALFVRDAALLVNVFFLLTFVLVAASGFIVARRLGVSVALSYPVAILYSLLPYHFGRAIGHLFLSGYYLVPVAVLIAVEISRGNALLDRARPARLAAVVLACVALGSSGIYYPFFASLFIVLAGVTASLLRRSRAPFGTSAAIAGIIFASLVFNHLPSIVKDQREGSLGVASRVPAEVEYFGLKISQLVLPVSGHRLESLAHLRDRYNRGPLMTENDMSSLGLFGAAGFVLLLAWLLWIKPPAREMNRGEGLLHHLSVLNAGGLLFATIGGFASIFALVISPQVRSVNRISVFIAYFSMVAAAIAIDRLVGGRPRWVAPIAAAIIIAAGALDQTGASVRRFRGDEASFEEYRRYVRRIEAALPPDASVFQLPYFPFPENGAIEGIGDYEPFRPYLASRTTEWSYGAVRGSVGDLWQREVAALEPEPMIRTLAQAGFDAIWIDRRGHPDRAAALERELARFAGAIPFASPDGDYALIPLQLARYRISKEMGRDEWDAAAHDAAGRLLVSWRSGFSRTESDPSGEWRWGSRKGEIILHNPGARPREASVRFTIETGRDEPSALEISSPFWNETLTLGAEPVPIERRVTVPPGSHRLRFRSTADPIDAPADPRVLVFQLRDFRLDTAAGG